MKRAVAKRKTQLKANSVWKPCCGFVSTLILVGWIRTLIQEAKNDSQKKKKMKCWMFSFEDLELLL
jgi:hypothetical protein